MSTQSYPSQTGFDSMGRGVNVMADMLRAPAAEPQNARQSGLRAMFKRMMAAWVANREAAAMDIVARYDRRVAADLRAARDHAEWTK